MGNFEKGTGKSKPSYGFSILWLILLGGFCIAWGGMFLFKPQLASLECDRSQPDSGECKLVMSGLFGEEVTTFPVEQLKGAEVRGGRRSRQLVLLTSDERFYFPGGSGSLQNANQINDFVRDPGSQSLNLKQDSRWSAYPIGGALLLVSGVSLRLLASGFLDRSAKPSNS